MALAVIGADVVFQALAPGHRAAGGGRRSAGGDVDGHSASRRTFGLSWALSASVAAAGGILLGNLTGVNFTLADLGLQVFPVVILGGLDSIVGAIVGGFLIGVLQNVASGYLGSVRGWRRQERLSVLRPDRHPDGEAVRPVRACRHRAGVVMRHITTLRHALRCSLVLYRRACRWWLRRTRCTSSTHSWSPASPRSASIC